MLPNTADGMSVTNRQSATVLMRIVQSVRKLQTNLSDGLERVTDKKFKCTKQLINSHSLMEFEDSTTVI